MKYIYIPFQRKNAGNLDYLANTWVTNSNDDIGIIYYGDDFDSGDLENNVEIYIAAHGGSQDNDFLLYNNNPSDATSLHITIDTLIHRFQSDFLNACAQIKNIHIYCCGSFPKNYQLSQMFQNNLIRNTAHIHFYHGTITVPYVDGQAWSFHNSITQAIPVEQVKLTLFPRVKAKALNENKPRVSLKHNASVSFEEFKKNNRNRFWKRHDAKRNEWVDKKRNQEVVYKY